MKWTTGTTTRTIRAAAVQMCAELGAVDANCAAAERLTREAFAEGAEWVILPEFFTSGMAFHSKLLSAASPVDGTPFQLLRRLAAEHAGVVGGSFISQRGVDRYNTFVLAFPDGSTFSHDKDLPSMWESCYYVGGTDDGVVETPTGPVGIAMCWELIRSQTVRRMSGRVDIVVGGSCWWDLPDGVEGAEYDDARAANRALLASTPGTFAKMLGVPFIHASHAGEFEGLTPGAEHLPYRSRMLGETQIVDGTGEVIARRTQDEGEGIILAEIVPGLAAEQRPSTPNTFWIPKLPDAELAAWAEQGEHGRSYYQRVTRRETP